MPIKNSAAAGEFVHGKTLLRHSRQSQASPLHQPTDKPGMTELRAQTGAPACGSAGFKDVQMPPHQKQDAFAAQVEHTVMFSHGIGARFQNKSW